MDGVATRSCGISVTEAEGKKITTIEGLASGSTLHKVQHAWIAKDVPQCGYCQSGMIMAVAALLNDKPKPTDADIDEAITNICRCGTFQQVREAIHAINAVAEKIGWTTPAPQGVYRGIAQVMGYGSYVAGVGEISVADGNKIKVLRIVASTDPGYVVNPAQVERQIAGSFVYGLSALFHGGCTVKDGRIEQTNFDTFKSMRINEMPKVEARNEVIAGLRDIEAQQFEYDRLAAEGVTVIGQAVSAIEPQLRSCHSGPFPETRFQGDLAPDLSGAGNRWTVSQLRLRMVDASRFKPDTIMPSYCRADRLVRVGRGFMGKPILSAAELEDIVAFLATLRD
ncbi:hypothetical protein ACVMAJ_005988 [Bradyrhizobium sp. USDA 4448]